jgi:RNase P protein component
VFEHPPYQLLTSKDDTIRSIVDTSSSMNTSSSSMVYTPSPIVGLSASAEAVQRVMNATEGSMEDYIVIARRSAKRSKSNRIPKILRRNIKRTQKYMKKIIMKAYPDAEPSDIKKYVKGTIFEAFGYALAKCVELTNSQINETLYNVSTANGDLA